MPKKHPKIADTCQCPYFYKNNQVITYKILNCLFIFKENVVAVKDFFNILMNINSYLVIKSIFKGHVQTVNNMYFLVRKMASNQFVNPQIVMHQTKQDTRILVLLYQFVEMKNWLTLMLKQTKQIVN